VIDLDPPAHTVRASRVAMTELVLPEDTNTWGSIFGGRVMALVDKCAAMAAMRHGRCRVLTASVDRVDFLHPIHEGEMILLEAEVHATFGSSMEVGVIVYSENPLSGARQKTCRALVTMVAVDGEGRPVRVAPLVLESEQERARARRASSRREDRLARRLKDG
jgi:acyl-CoA hydrolase